jgi:CBS domain-containing protein
VLVPPELTVGSLVDERLMASDQRVFPVMEGDELLGLVTPADVRRIPRSAWGEKRVRDIMVGRADLVVASPDEEATTAFERLAARDVEQLPVLVDGRFAGFFRRRDVLRWLELQNRGLPSLHRRQA